MKYLFSILLLLGASLCSAQPATMRIHLKDGSTREFDVDSITEAGFSHVNLPDYNYLRAFKHTAEQQMIEGWIYPRFRPKLFFDRDTLGFRKLTVANDVFYILNSPFPDDPATAVLDSIVVYNFYRDTNLIKIQQPFISGLWHLDTLIVSPLLTRFRLSPSLQLTQLGEMSNVPMIYSLDYSPTTNKLLAVKSSYLDVSFGVLLEIDTKTGDTVQLDTLSSVSRAVYDPNDPNVIFYYTYGSYVKGENEHPSNAGYYRWNRVSGERSLLLQHISDFGPEEGLNGFDVHPNGNRILLPVTSVGKAPIALEYDLSSGLQDTIDLDFDITHGKYCLWLAYDHEGSRFVYSNFPTGVLWEGRAETSSDIGIYSFIDQAVQRLNIIPDTFFRDYVILFPEFVPNRNALSFSASRVEYEPPGYVVDYNYYILTRLP
jgi:hypothetical protein